ncbi:MAG: uridine kinase [Lactobacillus sp.]|jgi:uridine kinase|nr:uridine kinase [Lactobacillus sp.]MCH3906658.1 uridine kinase [Lactobacillus sp.]MCH3989706.1 uridine kinase [Lactobacillus sp.]MCH4068128.1 uridine kinase [Lactobacillus sp.]MCI1304309.1 uridine kinase [Lactobacillus sp.]
METNKKKKNKPLVIGIAGGSGSGKTTIAREIRKKLPNDRILAVTQDAYYKDNAGIPMEERRKINYDHPDAYDMPLMIKQLNQLLNWQAVDMPVYDFTKLTRSSETVHVEPAGIILLEGILVLTDKRLRDMMDIKVFVDNDDDIRFIRRLKRDTEKRARSQEQVINQYLKTVKPMYNQFVEPSKRYADIIVPEGGHNHVAIHMLANQIRSILRNEDQF